jgi:hypothetical protein
MTLRSKLDVDLVCHDAGTATFVVNSVSDHFLIEPNVIRYIGSATVGTSAVSISGPTVLSTLVVKNEGVQPLRLAGAIDVSAGRVAVLPVTATVTVASVSGQGSYTALWVG